MCYFSGYQNTKFTSQTKVRIFFCSRNITLICLNRHNRFERIKIYYDCFVKKLKTRLSKKIDLFYVFMFFVNKTNQCHNRMFYILWRYNVLNAKQNVIYIEKTIFKITKHETFCTRKCSFLVALSSLVEHLFSLAASQWCLLDDAFVVLRWCFHDDRIALVLGGKLLEYLFGEIQVGVEAVEVFKKSDIAVQCMLVSLYRFASYITISGYLQS